MCNKIIFIVCRNKQSCRIKGKGVGGKTEAVPPDGARGWKKGGLKRKGEFSGRRRANSDIADNETSAHNQGHSQ